MERKEIKEEEGKGKKKGKRALAGMAQGIGCCPGAPNGHQFDFQPGYMPGL